MDVYILYYLMDHDVKYYLFFLRNFVTPMRPHGQYDEGCSAQPSCKYPYTFNHSFDLWDTSN